MKRILLVKTSSLGDVIHNLPALTDIHAHFPDAQVDWVVEAAFAEIPKLHPHVNQVFTVALRKWRKQLWCAKTWQEIAQARQLIQTQSYDAIIDTQGLLKSALIAQQANGERHGYDRHSIREPLASHFYHQTHAISYQQHAVTRNRALVAMSLDYAPPNDAPDYGIQTPDFLAKNTQNNAAGNRMDIGLQGSYVVGLHGTSRDSKLWPVDHWVALGKQLATKHCQLVLPWASVAEFSRATAIAAQLSNGVVLPKSTITELAGIIARAKAAVGVDTGLSHLAAALNIPTVAIYTDTNPALTGVLAGAHAKAINLGGIAQTPSVDSVLAALQTVL